MSTFWTFSLSSSLFILLGWQHPWWSTFRTCRIRNPWFILPSWYNPWWSTFRTRMLSILWLNFQGWRCHWFNTFLSRRLLSVAKMIFPSWQDPGWKTFTISRLFVVVIVVNILSRDVADCRSGDLACDLYKSTHYVLIYNDIFSIKKTHCICHSNFSTSKSMFSYNAPYNNNVYGIYKFKKHQCFIYFELYLILLFQIGNRGFV